MDASRDKLGREEALKVKVSILIVTLLPVQSTGGGKLTRSQFGAVLGGSDLNSNSAARVEHQHVAKSLPDSRKQNIAKSRPDSQAQNIARFHESLLDLQPVAGTEYRTVAWHRIGTEYCTGVSQ